jgi:hypothetical protein
MAESNAVIQWLLEGDPAIRWQTLRDLLVLKWWEPNQRLPNER